MQREEVHDMIQLFWNNQHLKNFTPSRIFKPKYRNHARQDYIGAYVLVVCVVRKLEDFTCTNKPPTYGPGVSLYLLHDDTGHP